MKPKPPLGTPSRIFDRFAALRVLDGFPRFGSFSIIRGSGAAPVSSTGRVTYVSEHVSLMFPGHSLTRRGICPSNIVPDVEQQP
jgi:hypothetical protein